MQRNVALRKESVDRNNGAGRLKRGNDVALRKESVDRNNACACMRCLLMSSLSARRAWIEIGIPGGAFLCTFVALRKESVDRNGWMAMAAQRGYGRSPQGERG